MHLLWIYHVAEHFHIQQMRSRALELGAGGAMQLHSAAANQGPAIWIVYIDLLAIEDEADVVRPRRRLVEGERAADRRPHDALELRCQAALILDRTVALVTRAT